MKLFSIVLASASAMGMGKLNPQAMGLVEPEAQPEIKVAHSCEWDYQGKQENLYLSLTFFCQGENNRRIECEAGEVLEILDAWYGRESSSICNVQRGGGLLYNAPGACRADAKAVIQRRCDGRRNCSLA
jgi:hypothetical protein